MLLTMVRLVNSLYWLKQVPVMNLEVFVFAIMAKLMHTKKHIFLLQMVQQVL